MKRLHLYAAGVAVALVPAVVGLAGNASFSQSVPVKAPASTSDDAAGHDANDDRVTGVDDSRPRTTPMPRPRATRTAEPGDDHGRRHGGHGADDATGSGRHHSSDDPATHDVGDDHGGDRDRSGSGTSGSGTSGRGGSDDPATHDAGDDHGGDRDRSGSGRSGGSGGGSDDGGHHSGGDDRGSGGHGSDD